MIEKTADIICETFQDKTVCLQAILNFGEVLFPSLWDKFTDPERVCQGLFLCPRTIHRENLKGFVDGVLKDKPPTKNVVPTKRSTYNILQLTDPHIDLQYDTVL